MTDERFDRQIRFFGKEGQVMISSARVVVVGIGGLGSHVAQQLALLGVGHFSLIDDDELDTSNLNRLVGARHDDPIPGTAKVDIGARTILSINPNIIVEKVKEPLQSEAGLSAVAHATHVFGCVDREGVRLILNKWCAAYDRPYFDLASDILLDGSLKYGGRICISWHGEGCITCLDILDTREAQEDLEGEAARKDRAAIYGVDSKHLDRSGPSVVSINGVVASLGVTEFMAAVSGLRLPHRLLNYHGSAGKVTLSQIQGRPWEDCYYCKGIRGKGDSVDCRSDIKNPS